MDIAKELAALDLDPTRKTLADGTLVARSPIDGSVTAKVKEDDAASVDAAIARAHAAYLEWRSVPAPRRGELIRLLGEELRKEKDALASLVTIEAGKITAEARGEVQEMIDICDFACGLSRQLYGLTIASERPGHRMMETWHPLGVVGVISAFNFPVAVWAWNFCLAVVCGNAVVWKPSEKTPLTAAACQALFAARERTSSAATPAGLSARSFRARPPSASASSTTSASPSSARRAPRAWARRLVRVSPRASVARSSSSAATTR